MDDAGKAGHQGGQQRRPPRGRGDDAAPGAARGRGLPGAGGRHAALPPVHGRPLLDPRVRLRRRPEDVSRPAPLLAAPQRQGRRRLSADPGHHRRNGRPPIPPAGSAGTARCRAGRSDRSDEGRGGRSREPRRRRAMSRKANILLLEDKPEDAELVARLLAGAGISSEIRRVDTRQGYAAALSEGPFDLILSDYGLPGFDGSAALALARSLHPETPFIVVSGQIGEDHAIEMLRQGATDYVLKDRLSRLAPAVERALREAEERTARRRAEQAMQLQREMLLRNEHLEVVASVVAGVAHELNNPLALLVGHATLLKRKVGEGPLADRAEKLMQAADRCSRIVRSFLALARRHPPEREPVDLRKLVRETLEILAYGFRVDGVEVEVDLPEDLPRLPAADPDRLRQVLVNLAVNAHHALRQTTGGKRRLSMRAQVAPPARVVRLAVEDNGPGIPADLRERIFEPFFSTKPAGEGTGLG